MNPGQPTQYGSEDLVNPIPGNAVRSIGLARFQKQRHFFICFSGPFVFDVFINIAHE